MTGILLVRARRLGNRLGVEATTGRDVRHVSLLLACALLTCLVVYPIGASALTTGEPLRTGFPRLGLQWPNPAVQSLAEIARYDYVLLQPNQGAYVGLLKALNPNIIIMTSTNPCEIGLDTSVTPPSWANAEISKLPNEWIQTQLGSKLTAAVDSDSPVFPVYDASRFRVGDTVVIEKELAKVLSVRTGSVTVRRGLIPQRSAAAPHPMGTRVAPVVIFWPGSVVMDLSEFCPRATVDASVGPETWVEYNRRVGMRLLDETYWDGVFIDRADATPSMIVSGDWTRSIDPQRNNTPVTDGYAALDASWRRNLYKYELGIRSAAGQRAILTNNAYPNFDLLNGMIFEATPRLTWSAARWSDRVFGTGAGAGRSYSDWMASALQPNFTTIQTYESDLSPAKGGPRYTPPAGWNPDYRKMRFGLSTALMKDGFFNYGLSTAGHASTGVLWFDEFDNAGRATGYLGQPTKTARLALPPLASPDLVKADGSFSSAARMNRWSTRSTTGYSVSKALSGGTARITVTRSRGALAGASFAHQNLPISRNAIYTLRFRARASRPLDIVVGGRRVTSPYTNYLPFGKASLGTAWRSYTFVTTSKGSASAAGLYFFLGQKTGTIWLDDVKVQKGWRPNVYRRDFQNGIALVNPESKPVAVPLGAMYRKLAGTQAPSINNGAYVSSVTLGAQDGLILLRTPVLTIPSDRTVSFGSTITVSGSLKSVSGVALSNRRIVLRSSLDGRTWTAAAETTTSASGTYSFSVQPRRNTYYTTRFYRDGDPQNLESLSRTMAVKVRVNMSDPAAPATMSRTRYYTMSGYLKPKHTTGTYPVRIYKWRYVSGKWKSYGYASAKAYNFSTSQYTKYARSIRLPYAGTWRLRAYHPADTAHAATWSSGYDRVTVR